MIYFKLGYSWRTREQRVRHTLRIGCQPFDFLDGEVRDVGTPQSGSARDESRETERAVGAREISGDLLREIQRFHVGRSRQPVIRLPLALGTGILMMTSTDVAGCGLHAVRSLAIAGLLLSAGIVSAQDAAIAAFKTVDSMEARVQGCVTCHGQSGQGTSNEYFPRIAGKPAAYLYNQLVAFRDGKRVYPPMNYLVANLPDAYLKDIAEHFAKERPPSRRSSKRPRLLRRSRAARRLPSQATPAGRSRHASPAMAPA